VTEGERTKGLSYPSCYQSIECSLRNTSRFRLLAAVTNKHVIVQVSECMSELIN
jgi:hypothetical protein